MVTSRVKLHEFNPEYGYIDVVYDQKEKYYVVKDFIKKPEHKLSNYHYWNSGIFVFKAKRYIGETKKYVLHFYNCIVQV